MTFIELTRMKPTPVRESNEYQAADSVSLVNMSLVEVIDHHKYGSMLWSSDCSFFLAKESIAEIKTLLLTEKIKEKCLNEQR